MWHGGVFPLFLVSDSPPYVGTSQALLENGSVDGCGEGVWGDFRAGAGAASLSDATEPLPRRANSQHRRAIASSQGEMSGPACLGRRWCAIEPTAVVYVVGVVGVFAGKGQVRLVFLTQLSLYISAPTPITGERSPRLTTSACQGQRW